MKTFPTFEDCAASLGWKRAERWGPLAGGKPSRPLANNTRLSVGDTSRTGDGEPVAFDVTLHYTDIVTVYRSGVYRLRMGGWNTMTTRSRLNAYSPADVSTDRGVPYVFWDSGRVLRLWDTFDPAEDNYLPLARYRVPFS